MNMASKCVIQCESVSICTHCNPDYICDSSYYTTCYASYDLCSIATGMKVFETLTQCKQGTFVGESSLKGMLLVCQLV